MTDETHASRSAGTGTAEPLHTDVLVVGSGPAGASTALFLARHGIDVTLITRSTWVADSPRAHITNQRTMEVFRAVDIEAAVRAQASPREMMANLVFCSSLAGPEFGRSWSWGNDPERAGDYAASSPLEGCDIPQDRLEPILLGEAARLGARIRFQTKFEALEQDDDGVTVHVTDQLTGAAAALRASYVVGADGGQSRVAEAIGLPFHGTAGVGNAMNVRFTADLSDFVAHRPGSLFEIIQPHRVDGMGHGMLRMVKPWHDWVVGFVHLGERNARLTEEEAVHEVRQLIGDDSVEVTITGMYPWRINHVVAEHFSAGRVFCVGDAVHRHPPMNGLGANTCVQDGFNLAWKLAYVVKGFAGADLLESYSAERQPVGAQIVDRAIASWHLGKKLLPAMGLDPNAPLAEREAEVALLAAPSDEGAARRAALREVLDERPYIVEAHGVEMNQRYLSGAVVPDGSQAGFTRDPELHVQQSSDPGARLPHAWVGSSKRTISTLDLVSPERFTLLALEGGAAWIDAAREVAEELNLDLIAIRIAPYEEISDLYGDFARRSGISESGCLLVRPDQHVAWRQTALADEPTAALRAALQQVLSLV